MRLLYIASLDFYTKPNPSFHLMKTMLEDVLDNEIEVLYVGCEEQGVDKHIPDELVSHPNFTYHLIPCKKIPKTNFPLRYFDGIRYSYAVSKFIRENIKNRDVVFVQSSPTVLYTLYYANKYATNQKIIYNIQDMFPGSAIASGSMTQKWMQKTFYALQKIAYKKSDLITVISEDMKIKVIEQGVPENKIRVIVNWYDDAAVHEIDWNDNLFVKKYNLSKNCFYVQYAGTMGTNFNPEPILEVAERLKKEKNIIFQMIGEGVRKEKFQKDATNLGLSNIVFYPLQSQDMVPHVYSACSVCIIPLQKGVIGNSVPSKAGLLMACRRVIVNSVDEYSDYANMFEREKIGLSSGIEDYDKLAKDILYLYENPKTCQEYGDRAAKYGKKEYSRSVNTCKYIDLFNSLGGER